MKKYLLFLIGFLSLTTSAFAVPYFRSEQSILPFTDNTYYIGTTTPSNLRYNGVFNNLTVSGTCTGCGGNPGGSATQLQYNNSGAFGGITGSSVSGSTVTLGTLNLTNPLGLSYGGWGCSNARTDISTTGTINNQAVTTCWLNFTGASGINLNGLVAQADGTIVQITNSTASQSILTIVNQSTGSTASNRIIGPANSQNTLVYYGNSVFLKYNTTLARWETISVYPTANSGITGLLTAADYSVFNAKPTGSGSSGRIAFWNSTSSLLSDANLYFLPSNGRLSVQAGTSPEAVGHFKSDYASILDILTGISVTLTQFNLLSAPSGYSTTQQPGHLYAPNYSSLGVTSDSTTYLAGDVLDYKIYAYTDDGMGNKTYSVVSLSLSGATITTGSGSDGDQVNLAWTDNTSGTASISGYVIFRQINGGGFNDYIDVGYVNLFTDTSGGWSGGTPIITSYPDFIANGSSRNYSAYSKDTTPASTAVYSSGNQPSTFTDDNSGNPYVIAHNITTSSANARIVNTDLNTFADGTSFTEDTTSPFASGSTVTPNTYGYLSDGSTLNRDYDFYNYNGSIYSSSSGIYSTVDPNDGNYYYNIISFSGISTSAKILLNINGAGYLASQVSATSPIYDDGITAFAGNTTVTPNATYVPSGLFENHGSDITTPQTLVLRSLDGSFSSIGFYNNANSRLGYIQQDGTEFSIYGNGGGHFTSDNTTSTFNIVAATSNRTASDITDDASNAGILRTGGNDRIGWSAGGVSIYAPSSGNIGLYYNGSPFLKVDSTGVTLQGSAITIPNSNNFVFGTTIGTKIGTATTQKLAFYNSSPIVQPGATTDLGTVLSNLGLRASGTAYPLTTSANVSLTGTGNNLGTITTGVWSGTAIGETKGGTNQTSYTQGDILYASGSNTLSKLAKNTSSTRYLSNTGTSNNPAWAQIDLTNGVTGALPLGNGGTNVTSTTQSYTPTRSAEANLDANVTMTAAQYVRVGNTVTVSGRFTADPTLAATATSFEITLPVASNIGAAEDAAGVSFCGSIAGQGAEIIGVAANDTAKIQWVSGDITSKTWSYTFTYRVI